MRKNHKIKKLFTFLSDFCLNLLLSYYGKLLRSPYKVFKLVFIFCAPVVLTHQEAMSMAYQMLLGIPNPKTGADCLPLIMAYVDTGKFVDLYHFILQFSDILDTLTPEEIRKIEEYLDGVLWKDDDAFDALYKSGLYDGDFNEFRQKISSFAEEYKIGPKYSAK